MKHTRNFDNFINESAKSDKLAALFVKDIVKVDDSLSYVDLATAVATIIKEEYGDHNIAPFMKELHKQLGLKESVNEDEEVFMASNSLNKIIDDASELLEKIGEEEVNLPAWIQDHIVKAEECLSHANEGFYVEESVKEAKDSDTFEGNPGEDKRMVDIRAFRGSVKDLTDFIDDKIKASKLDESSIKTATNKHGEHFKIGDTIVAPDNKPVKITGFMVGKDGHMKAMYNAGMFADVYNLDDVEKA